MKFGGFPVKGLSFTNECVDYILNHSQ